MLELLPQIFTIVVLDLVLGGDNAVVIAMAVRKLPQAQRNRAIYWGTFGALIIRLLMTFVAIWLLSIPYLQALGGLILIPIALHLFKGDDEVHTIATSTKFYEAIRTIIIADATMGIDNVLGIAGASHGNMMLVVFGLAISVPIIVWGSKCIASWMERYPILVYGGAGILAWTAGSMIIHDKSIGGLLATHLSAVPPQLIPLSVVIFVLGMGLFQAQKSHG